MQKYAKPPNMQGAVNPLYWITKLNTDAMLQSLLLFLCLGVVYVGLHPESLFLTDSFDEMLGVVCVCFALKVQLKCVGFPAL